MYTSKAVYRKMDRWLTPICGIPIDRYSDTVVVSGQGGPRINASHEDISPSRNENSFANVVPESILTPDRELVKPLNNTMMN